MKDGERNRIFEGWIEAHKAILFKVARAYGASHSDREVLFQEIALQVWHSVDAFRGDSAASTWIYRVALNTAIAWQRRERKHGKGRQDIEAASGLRAGRTSRRRAGCWPSRRCAIRGSSGSTPASPNSARSTAASRC